MTKLLTALTASAFAISAMAQAPASTSTAAPEAGVSQTAPGVTMKSGAARAKPAVLPTKAITEAPKTDVTKAETGKSGTKSTKKAKKKPKKKTTDPKPV